MHGGRVVCPLCRAPFSTKDVLASSYLEEVQSKAAERAAADEAYAGAHAHGGGAAAAGGGDHKPPAPPEDPAVAARDDGKLTRPARPLMVASMIHQLRQAWASDPGQKAVIFSQFVGMLNIVQRELDAEGIASLRIDGSVPSDERKRVIREFGLDGGARVILVSLKAGGQGINLTRGNWVFMLDLWWNDSVEEQAMHRVYRIGQSRPVTVVRYVCAGTIEERILALQERKKILGQGALAKVSADQVRATRISDLRSMFSSELV